MQQIDQYYHSSLIRHRTDVFITSCLVISKRSSHETCTYTWRNTSENQPRDNNCSLIVVDNPMCSNSCVNEKDQHRNTLNPKALVTAIQTEQYMYMHRTPKGSQLGPLWKFLVEHSGLAFCYSREAWQIFSPRKCVKRGWNV